MDASIGEALFPPRVWQALATDYDGTIAREGLVAPDVCAALSRLRASGRKLLLVTGRELPELKGIFHQLDLFDLVVCENGGLLYHPAKDEETPLATEPAASLVALLQKSGVKPLSVGRSIIATFEPHEKEVLSAIRDLGLEMQVIFNKGAVMALPSGVNKASGLAAALERLNVPMDQVVAIGDAENDHALLAAVGLGVAVANAVPMLRERADLVTEQPNGRGVIELVDRLLADGLAGVTSKPREAKASAKLPAAGAS